MDVEREWRKEPPREPMTSLAALVRDFQWRFPRERRDMVLEFCRDAPTLAIAIERAVRSKDANGRHHNHQSKIAHWAYQPMIDSLLRNRPLIKLCRTFDELHDEVSDAAVTGWGPVGIYDISTRIGAFLKLEPTSVYMHAGVKQGWIELANACPTWFSQTTVAWKKRVPHKSLPHELLVLTADEAEDFLCTYRWVFHLIKES